MTDPDPFTEIREALRLGQDLAMGRNRAECLDGWDAAFVALATLEREAAERETALRDREHRIELHAVDPPTESLAERLGAHFTVGPDEPPMPALDANGVIELADAAEARSRASRPPVDAPPEPTT